MTECVAVIRMKNGIDLLAILIGDIENMIRVEHPYYVKVNTYSNKFSLIPYCSLSDETYYEIHREKVEFVVPASHEVSIKFLSAIDEANAIKAETVAEMIEEDNYLDQLEAKLTNKNFIEGNDTKH